MISYDISKTLGSGLFVFEIIQTIKELDFVSLIGGFRLAQI